MMAIIKRDARWIAIGMLLIVCGCDRPESGVAITSDSKAMAATTTPANSAFTGSFYGMVSGIQTILRLTRQQNRINGTIINSLANAPFSAIVNGSTAEGDLKDPGNSLITGRIRMTLENEQLMVSAFLSNAETGRSVDLPPVAFARGEPPLPTTRTIQP
jgi:hypothetical protein